MCLYIVASFETQVLPHLGANDSQSLEWQAPAASGCDARRPPSPIYGVMSSQPPAAQNRSCGNWSGPNASSLLDCAMGSPVGVLSLPDADGSPQPAASTSCSSAPAAATSPSAVRRGPGSHGRRRGLGFARKGVDEFLSVSLEGGRQEFVPGGWGTRQGGPSEGPSFSRAGASTHERRMAGGVTGGPEEDDDDEELRAGWR